MTPSRALLPAANPADPSHAAFSPVPSTDPQSVLRRAPWGWPDAAIPAPAARRYEIGWTSAEALARDAQAWRSLATDAIEPNPMYGANVLVAAERHLRKGRALKLLVARDGRDGSLAAVAPLEDRGWSNGFPGRALGCYVNPFITLTHPLIRREDAAAILSELLRFMGEETGRAALLAPFLAERRAFFDLLSDVARREGLALSRVDGFSRPAVEPEPGKGAAGYARNYLSKNRRSNVERRLKRLRELGTVAFGDVLADAPGGGEALRAFLELEHKGWKGKANTALMSRESTHAFALAAFSGTGEAPRVRIRSLTLDGRPIAMALDLESQDASYAFKGAYDEDFAAHGPGLVLDLDTASRIGSDGETRRLDSFAMTAVAQDGVWRQSEPMGRYLLSLSPGDAAAPTLASRLRAVSRAKQRIRGARAFLRSLTRPDG